MEIRPDILEADDILCHIYMFEKLHFLRQHQVIKVHMHRLYFTYIITM